MTHNESANTRAIYEQTRTHDKLLDKIEDIEYWQEQYAGKTFIKAFRAVVKLHKPDLVMYDDGSGCLCGNEYPCSTIEAIENELNK